MNRPAAPLPPARSLLLALLLAPAAAAQTTTVVFEGQVASVDGPIPAPFDAVSVGQPFIVTIEVRLPGTTTPGEIDTEYEVVEARSDVRIGGAVDFPLAGQTFFVPSDPNVGGATAALTLTSGVTLNALLFDTPPLTTFLTGDLEQLAGTYLASEFDLTFLDLVAGTTGGDQIRGDLDRVIVGPGANSVGESYCGPAVVNSTGLPGVMGARGSSRLVEQDLTLLARRLPANSFAFFLASRTEGFIATPGTSSGNLCLNGAIGRFVGPGQIQNAGADGSVELAVDAQAIPSPTGPVSLAPGQTWFFQCWYRDQVGGVAGSNFTDGLRIVFE